MLAHAHRPARVDTAGSYVHTTSVRAGSCIHCNRKNPGEPVADALLIIVDIIISFGKYGRQPKCQISKTKRQKTSRKFNGGIFFFFLHNVTGLQPLPPLWYIVFTVKGFNNFPLFPKSLSCSPRIERGAGTLSVIIKRLLLLLRPLNTMRQQKDNIGRVNTRAG